MFFFLLCTTTERTRCCWCTGRIPIRQGVSLVARFPEELRRTRNVHASTYIFTRDKVSRFDELSQANSRLANQSARQLASRSANQLASQLASQLSRHLCIPFFLSLTRCSLRRMKKRERKNVELPLAQWCIVARVAHITVVPIPIFLFFILISIIIYHIISNLSILHTKIFLCL